MKKFMAICALGVIVSGCATTDGTTQNPLTQTGKSLLKSAIHQKCQSDIVNHQYMKVLGTFLGTDAHAKVSGTICTCVSEHGIEQVTLTEAATAVVDSNARPKIVAKAVQGSMKACANDYIQKSPFAGLIKL